MATLTNKTITVFAETVEFDDIMLHVELTDGRIISVPMEWFPTLRNATKKERNDWRLIGKGIGIHWNKLDEDISINALL